MTQPNNSKVDLDSYKSLLENSNIQSIYEKLRKSMLTLKVHFQKELGHEYSFGNISPGYMDFTYFPFSNCFLEGRKLRFGIIFNHKKIRFELWLMGRNHEIQVKYWEMLKGLKWNKEFLLMPKYSVLEITLGTELNSNSFDNFDGLAKLLIAQTKPIIKEIEISINNLET